MEKIIIENQYFMCINALKNMFIYPFFKIEQYEHYKKMSFRNRCVIVGSNGLIHLSVPITGGRNTKQLIKDVKISYTDPWQQQHKKAILSSYAKAPFFEHYIDSILTLIEKKHTFLFDKNYDILVWIMKVLKNQREIDLTTEYIKSFSSDEIDCRNRWMPNNFQEEDENLIKYPQVFEDKLGFQPNVSILDLLFCEGPLSNSLLKR